MNLCYAAAFAAAVSVGCARPGVSPAPVVGDRSVVEPPGVAARAQFDAALTTFVRHDEANDWTEAACASVASMFEAAAAAQKGPFPQATYNAGLAHQRCHAEARAKALFERAANDDPTFHAAQAKLALYRHKGGADVDRAIAALQKSVEDGQFKNVAALVDLATMQMDRGGAHAAPGCKDDFECARLNLQRALAIEDAYMPALNQLALYYFQLARRRAGAHERGGVQQLELAALVCSQAIRKNARYAPIHNTAGLIQYELGHVNRAVEAFATAMKLDPESFEAHMNYAAVNLSFRGFEPAEQAYRKAIALRPNDYDAHLGLALSLRGPITGAEPDCDRRVAAVQRELDAAKRIDEGRPDAWFNEGILRHELEARPGSGSDAQTIATLEKAEASFNRFIDKARGKAAYDGAVARARERLEDIDTAKGFLRSQPSAQRGR
ncbi:MAG: hypothetical protein KF819_12085 [Labilithrix sp.]|nr:hypothetical protein [Labilithrix sp.]